MNAMRGFTSFIQNWEIHVSHLISRGVVVLFAWVIGGRLNVIGRCDSCFNFLFARLALALRAGRRGLRHAFGAGGNFASCILLYFYDMVVPKEGASTDQNRARHEDSQPKTWVTHRFRLGGN